MRGDAARHPKPSPRHPMTAVTRLLLVRHGVTEANALGRLQGHQRTPLSEEGRQQAARIAHRLASEPIHAVWSSDLPRAYETAEAIARCHSLAPQPTALLRECACGEWEGLTRDEIVAKGDGPLLEARRRDPASLPPPGGETLAQMWERVVLCRRQMLERHPGCTIVVVGHMGSLRVLFCDALGLGMEGWRSVWLENCSLTIVEHGPGATPIRLVNDTCHLRQDIRQEPEHPTYS